MAEVTDFLPGLLLVVLFLRLFLLCRAAGKAMGRLQTAQEIKAFAQKHGNDPMLFFSMLLNPFIWDMDKFFEKDNKE